MSIELAMAVRTVAAELQHATEKEGQAMLSLPTTTEGMLIASRMKQRYAESKTYEFEQLLGFHDLRFVLSLKD